MFYNVFIVAPPDTNRHNVNECPEGLFAFLQHLFRSLAYLILPRFGKGAGHFDN